MPTTLLDSQLATLEHFDPDEPGHVVDISGTPGQIAEQIAGTLGH
jgi:gluconate kinase